MDYYTKGSKPMVVYIHTKIYIDTKIYLSIYIYLCVLCVPLSLQPVLACPED